MLAFLLSAQVSPLVQLPIQDGLLINSEERQISDIYGVGLMRLLEGQVTGYEILCWSISGHAGTLLSQQ